MIKTVYVEDNAVIILNQSRLPEQLEYIKCHTPQQVAAAIKFLQVRGAPLIGVTAAFGLAMAIKNYTGPRKQMDTYFQQVKELLESTRPTAINLMWALQRMEKYYYFLKGTDKDNVGSALLEEAQKMYREDIAANRAIGDFGEQLLPDQARVLTICNAGALATCGYGTALGVIRSAAEKGKIEMVWACETRPVLQGARLTVWELTRDNIPVTLITDSMAGYLMARGQVDAIVVGADRIVANGDTANKIGTYTLAVLASYHKVSLYIAAPTSTFDLSIARGDQIPIEERDPDEIRCIQGNYLTVRDAEVFNPAFDITPHELIKAYITEKGILKSPLSEALKGW